MPPLCANAKRPTYGACVSGGRLHDLGGVVGEPRQPAQPLGVHAREPELELQVGDDRDEVGVAAALAVAVQRALHLACAGARPRRSSSRRRTPRRRACGCRSPRAHRARRRSRAWPPRSSRAGSPPFVSHRMTDSAPASTAVLRQRRAYAASARVAVEEVLGVVEDRACPRARRNAIDSSIIAQVLVAVDAQRPSRCAGPRSCRRSSRRARSTRRARAARRPRPRRRRGGGSSRTRRSRRAAAGRPRARGTARRPSGSTRESRPR